jgi:hypothetical protein
MGYKSSELIQRLQKKNDSSVEKQDKWFYSALLLEWKEAPFYRGGESLLL